ncbi:MAG: phytanoyl-CoA dioxygenase family protein [Armatimonadota bacterium]|nr:phytanoyl-CoA dioxygenase family protein [Armatimonadota bacterium]
MDDNQKYEFDRQGFLILKGLLTLTERTSLATALDELEDHALRHVNLPPRKQGAFDMNYHRNEQRGYHVTGGHEVGHTMIIEDFFNADPAFDILINHPGPMRCIRSIVQGRIRINNSEIRLRYPGNTTGTHMGGPIDHKYRYSFNAQGIDCMMVRMIYFLHPVKVEDGAFCVVPGTHKTNYPSPYGSDPHKEPGMIGLEVKAGDGILFTENLRHGGLINRSERTRKTIHIGYGPAWMMSQNISTMDEPQYILPGTIARYTEAQKELVVL